MTEIPSLETDRLLLRSPRMEDWPAFQEMMLSERSVFMGGPFSTRVAWGLFCHGVALWELMGHGALMIEDRTSGQCLGHGPLFPERELGWSVYPQAEGQGYAFEAAKALRDWAFETLALETLVSYIDPGNTRSRKLAERLGAKLDPDAPGQDPTLRPEDSFGALRLHLAGRSTRQNCVNLRTN